LIHDHIVSQVEATLCLVCAHPAEVSFEKGLLQEATRALVNAIVLRRVATVVELRLRKVVYLTLLGRNDARVYDRTQHSIIWAFKCDLIFEVDILVHTAGVSLSQVSHCQLAEGPFVEVVVESIALAVCYNHRDLKYHNEGKCGHEIPHHGEVSDNSESIALIWVL